MDVRDAVEADAERLGELAGGPRDVMRNLVHDRTVRVAVESTDDAQSPDDAQATDDAQASENGHAEESDVDESDSGDGAAEPVTGFVSFDAREGTVHVTQLAGDAEACARLLEEPIRFAEGEGMAVELLVPEDEETVRRAAENAQFQRSGTGPRFEGTPTTRYRLDPGRATQ